MPCLRVVSTVPAVLEVLVPGGLTATAGYGIMQVHNLAARKAPRGQRR